MITASLGHLLMRVAVGQAGLNKVRGWVGVDRGWGGQASDKRHGWVLVNEV